MKKKLSCLIIALAMLAGMSGCSDGSAGTDTSSSAKYNMTLTLWLPTSENTTDAAITKVENAINKITKKNYKTAVEIHAIEDDKYEETIKQKTLEVEKSEKENAAAEAERKKAEREARRRGETVSRAETETTDVESAVVVTDENGDSVVEEVYPSVKTNQIDVFCIRGYDDFVYYTDNGYVLPVDETLTTSSKLLRSYIYPTFLEAGQRGGSTYAIPNSHVIGEYTYLLINKKLCDSLYYDPSMFNSLTDCQQFIEDVGATSSVTPLVSETTLPGLKHWGSDSSPKFSVLGTIVSDEVDVSTRLNIRNVFGLKKYTESLTMLKELREKGYLSTDVDGATSFGVAVMNSTAKDIKKYENDYYIKVLQKPRAESEDMYQSMFAVSAYTLDMSRSMELITLINTDSTIRTLLQYGVEGTHWEKDKDANGEETIKIISDEYQMDLINTGNVFITYPGEGLPMSYWDDGRQQNIDSLASPFLGFSVDKNDEENAKYFENLKELDEYSATIFARVDAMTAAEFTESLSALKDEVAASKAYNDNLDSNDFDSLISRYSSFYDETYGQN